MISQNDFTESFPDKFTDDDYEYCWEFKEDILQIKNDYKQHVVDLGWYPEFQADGQYTLVLVDTSEANGEGSSYWNVVVEYRSRDIDAIRMKIEELLKYKV